MAGGVHFGDQPDRGRRARQDRRRHDGRLQEDPRETTPAPCGPRVDSVSTPCRLRVDSVST
eukprot:6939981-Prymnesium_polylepis.1